MATGSGVRQTEPAFQESFSLRGAPVSGGASEEVLQSGNCEKSISGAIARGVNACAPMTPAGPANAAAIPARSTVRRSKAELRWFSFSDIGSASHLRKAPPRAERLRFRAQSG